MFINILCRGYDVHTIHSNCNGIYTDAFNPSLNASEQDPTPFDVNNLTDLYILQSSTVSRSLLLRATGSSQHDHAPDKPRGPPDTPDYERRVHAPNIPAECRLLQHHVDADPAQGGRHAHDNARTQDGQEGGVRVAEHWVLQGLDEGQGRSEESDEEGEREVEGGEGREEDPQEEEEEGADELVLLCGWVVGGGQEIGENMGEDD
jgi:hypothetical protein